MDNQNMQVKPQNTVLKMNDINSLVIERIEIIDMCQRQLDTLKKISDNKYSLYQQRFNILTNSATEYAAIRSYVNITSQDTLDALYRYRVNLLCSEVNQLLLTGLAARGEQ